MYRPSLVSLHLFPHLFLSFVLVYCNLLFVEFFDLLAECEYSANSNKWATITTITTTKTLYRFMLRCLRFFYAARNYINSIRIYCLTHWHNNRSTNTLQTKRELHRQRKNDVNFKRISQWVSWCGRVIEKARKEKEWKTISWTISSYTAWFFSGGYIQ